MDEKKSDLEENILLDQLVDYKKTKEVYLNNQISIGFFLSKRN